MNRNFALIHDWVKKETKNLKKPWQQQSTCNLFYAVRSSLPKAIEKFFNNFRDHHLVTWDDVNFTVDFFVFFSTSYLPFFSTFGSFWWDEAYFLCLSVRTYIKLTTIYKVNKESLLWVIFNKIVETFICVYVETTKMSSDTTIQI